MHLNLKCSLIVFSTGSDRFKDSHSKDGALAILTSILYDQIFDFLTNVMTN